MFQLALLWQLTFFRIRSVERQILLKLSLFQKKRLFWPKHSRFAESFQFPKPGLLSSTH